MSIITSSANVIEKIGKTAVVVLPLKEYKNMLEDSEMRSSAPFRKKIVAARKEKKRYSSKEVRKLLGV